MRLTDLRGLGCGREGLFCAVSDCPCHKVTVRASILRQRWGKQGNRARVLFPFPETARLCFRRKRVLDWALEGTADHTLCTLSWELGGVRVALIFLSATRRERIPE